MTPILFPFQLDLIYRSRAHYARGLQRLLIQAATGAGKTHISSEIIRLAVERGKRVLFLAHRRRLIEQKSARLNLFGVPHGILMAGVHRTEAPVQVASRDTILSRSVRGKVDLPPADLLVVDEAHNLGDQYLELLRMYPQAKTLGMTATPTRSDGRGLGTYYQALECAAPVSQLVTDGYLVPVDCYAPLRMGEQRQKGVPVQGLAGDPVTCWKRWAGGKPTVVFSANIKASLAVRDSFLSQNIHAEHLDAGTADGERDEIITRVQSGMTQVVCNVGVWTEGVDVPELACCQLLRMCRSAVLFFQAVGRVMRRHPSKRRAVLIDHAGAVLQHGFPDEDLEWSLDEGQTVDERLAKAKESGQTKTPIVCPECAYLFHGSSTCPQCGAFVRQPRKSKPQQVRDELLQEVPRELSAARVSEEQQRFWHRCLAVMASKGRSAKCAGGMFYGKFKLWPDKVPNLRNVPKNDQWDESVRELFPQYYQRKAER